MAFWRETASPLTKRPTGMAYGGGQPGIVKSCFLFCGDNQIAPMKPITFACSESLSQPAADIAASILDLANWTDFKGYGVLPGIQAAVFECRTSEIVGTRIRVTNTDGSRHVEEIIEWNLPHSVRLRMDAFSPPLSSLASMFIESWVFRQAEGKTTVTRSMELHPKSLFTWPALWLISGLLKPAIAKHLRQMRDLNRLGRDRREPIQ